MLAGLILAPAASGPRPVACGFIDEAEATVRRGGWADLTPEDAATAWAARRLP